MKERISLTLDKKTLEKVDSKIDKLKVKNRSHAIELLLEKALRSKGISKGFILAGGKGTRLRPITHEIPKPMIPIKGRPILEHNIELLKKYDIRDIIISIGYKGDKIKEYFGNGSKFGVKISYVEEKQALGTAGPLRLAEKMLDDTFVMLNADNLFEIDLDDMYTFHKSHEGSATIALTTVSDPSSYGVAKMRGDKIMDFIEKPKKEDAPSKLINAGLYILEPEVVELVPKETREIKIETEIFPKLAKRNELFGYPFPGYWNDVGTMERYENAVKEWRF